MRFYGSMLDQGTGNVGRPVLIEARVDPFEAPTSGKATLERQPRTKSVAQSGLNRNKIISIQIVDQVTELVWVIFNISNMACGSGHRLGCAGFWQSVWAFC